MADLTLRNARNTIENAIVDTLYLAYGTRLPAAATVTVLRALPSGGLTDRALRSLTSAGLTYQWRRAETQADDGDTYIKPLDVTGPGRWVKTASAVASGYLKSAELFNDDSGDLDVFEQRIFGRVPAVLVSFEGAEHHPKSTEKGALYWTIMRFSVFAVSVNARAGQTARQGSPIAAEAAIDPGTAAMLGDVKDTLAGYDLDLNDVAFIEIRNETPVIRDEARARFVEVLDIEVYATLTHQDPSVYALADPYEFNMQLRLDDLDQSGFWDPDNHVVSGLQFPLGDGLTKTFASGQMFLSGALISITGAAHTFAANKVTFRDVLANGTLAYSATNYGDPPPAIATGGIRFGATVTDGTGVRLDRLLISSAINFGPSNQVDPP